MATKPSVVRSRIMQIYLHMCLCMLCTTMRGHQSHGRGFVFVLDMSNHLGGHLDGWQNSPHLGMSGMHDGGAVKPRCSAPDLCNDGKRADPSSTIDGERDTKREGQHAQTVVGTGHFGPGSSARTEETKAGLTKMDYL